MKNLNAHLYPSFIAREILVLLIRLYQYTLSLEHGLLGYALPYRVCRFVPSCSAYAIDALRQYGLPAGIMVSLKRILKCHPWHQGGYDPLL